MKKLIGRWLTGTFLVVFAVLAAAGKQSIVSRELSFSSATGITLRVSCTKQAMGSFCPDFTRVTFYKKPTDALVCYEEACATLPEFKAWVEARKGDGR